MRDDIGFDKPVKVHIEQHPARITGIDFLILKPVIGLALRFIRLIQDIILSYRTCKHQRRTVVPVIFLAFFLIKDPAHRGLTYGLISYFYPPLLHQLPILRRPVLQECRKIRLVNLPA